MRTSPDPNKTLRLIWPQWQGADPGVVEKTIPELPLATAQLGYHLGGQLLQIIAPAATGPEATVPVDMTQEGLRATDGIFAREVVLSQLKAALDTIAAHDPDRIVTLGGDCSVSVAPFSHLASRYGRDLAVVWVDTHPDTGMPQCDYDGYHAMALSHITGHGDPEIVERLPAPVDPSRVALAGVHVWDEDQEPYMNAWNLATFPPAQLNASCESLIDWLRATGCTRSAIHLDVDCVDGNEMVLGLGADPNGLTRDTVVRLLGRVAEVTDVVALTVAEFVPRRTLAMRDLLAKLPLIST